MSFRKVLLEGIDVAIAGGGIIGLWTAYEILTHKPELTVVVFEKERFFGEHTTGRNSEVLHAGIYYPYQSLKHLSCLEGNILWREFFNRYQLGFLDCGKYVVAPEQSSSSLEELIIKAEKNNVPDIRRITSKEIKELKVWVNCHSGFYSPSSAVIDVSGSLRLLRQLLEEKGCILLNQSELEIIRHDGDGFDLSTNGDHFRADILINAGGHFAIDLRLQLGLSDLHKKLVKGNYLSLKKKLGLSKLVYPIPPEHGLGLGVHLTLNCAGEQKLGPNTEIVENMDYSVNSDLINAMYPSVQNLFPTIQKEHLSLAYAGIRPRVVDSYGKLLTDFILNTPQEHQIKNYYEFLGIESPGLTAAPSLAKLLFKSVFQ